jgi:hypothetical protein
VLTDTNAARRARASGAVNLNTEEPDATPQDGRNRLDPVARMNVALAAIREHELTGNAATLAYYVAHRDGQGRGCFAGVDTMAADLGWSKGTVKRARAALIASGAVTHERAGRSPAVLRLAGSTGEPTNDQTPVAAGSTGEPTKSSTSGSDGSTGEPYVGSTGEPTQREGTRRTPNPGRGEEETMEELRAAFARRGLTLDAGRFAAQARAKGLRLSTLDRFNLDALAAELAADHARGFDDPRRVGNPSAAAPARLTADAARYRRRARSAVRMPEDYYAEQEDR